VGFFSNKLEKNLVCGTVVHFPQTMAF